MVLKHLLLPLSMCFIGSDLDLKATEEEVFRVEVVPHTGQLLFQVMVFGAHLIHTCTHIYTRVHTRIYTRIYTRMHT